MPVCRPGTHHETSIGRRLRYVEQPHKFWRRHNQRNALARLDDHLLHDIGLTAEDAAREAKKAILTGA
ncbi:MAG: DUF1127 domain-containing protein [Alphaproteobacteria bacterium]